MWPKGPIGAAMRKFVALAMVAVAVGAYALTPFLSAYQIRQAIRSGDTGLLETLVEWPAVRDSLKSSLVEIERKKTEHATRHGIPSPSLWSRIKSAATAGVVERMIDQHVTASGVVDLHNARASLKSMTNTIAAAPAGGEASSGGDALDPAADPADENAVARFVRFWSRVKRAEFRSPGLIELEVADRKVPERRYVGTMEFRGLGWKLTKLEVQGAGF